MPSKIRIAIIVQRYGPEVNGGAEMHCRLLAERLAVTKDVTVFTTCARDYQTWKPEYTPGTYKENNITVIRFHNHPFDKKKYRYYRRKLTNRLPLQKLGKLLGINSKNKINGKDNDEFFKAQGPYTPKLIEYIQQQQNEYDVFIFFTYLFYPTAMGVKICPGKSILIPTLHDEKQLYNPAYIPVLHAPAILIFNTRAEQILANRIFPGLQNKQIIAGIGVQKPIEIEQRIPVPPKPYLIYIGRVDKGKGCLDMINYFLKYLAKSSNKNIRLVIVGQLFMQKTDHPQIIYKGFITDAEKWEYIKNAEALIIPSSKESLSMVLLESLSAGVPVIVNEFSSVLKEHVELSNAGLSYKDDLSFQIALDTILANDKLKFQMKQNGPMYVQTHYSWDVIMQKINSCIQEIYESNLSYDKN